MSKEKNDLVAVRDEKGRFLPGNSEGQGRPVGSKNRITLLKIALEESVRHDMEQDIEEVLKLIIKQALEGDKASQRMVWDASMSKGISPSDKEAKSDKGFTVHHLHHEVATEKEDKDG